MKIEKQLGKKLLSCVDSMKMEILAASHYIHQNPEIGGQEFKSSARLMQDLARHGFEVTHPVGGMKTAFKARLKGKGSGPRIAFLAEYDALPVLGHACGHNFIGSASAFAGIAFERIMKHLPGEILVIGTPGEENLGGKIILLESGVFKDVDVAMMVHPSSETRMQAPSLAAHVWEFEFRGRAAHAAAMPWMGANALDALIQMFVSVDQMRKQQKPTVRTPGIVLYGGERANIVPDRALGQFSCRGEDYEELRDVVKRVKRCARAAALATGTKVKAWAEGPMYKDIKPNQVMVGLFEKNFLSLGGSIEKNPDRGHGSLDIGNISQVIPCIHPSIGIVPHNVANHTREFARGAASRRADEQLVMSVKTLSLTALDILLHPSLVKEMRKELPGEKS